MVTTITSYENEAGKKFLVATRFLHGSQLRLRYGKNKYGSGLFQAISQAKTFLDSLSPNDELMVLKGKLKVFRDVEKECFKIVKKREYSL